MVTLKKTWIDGYSGGRLVSLKDYCNGKAHMKGLGSFKLSVLKMLGEVCHKEVDTAVLPDKFKRLKRKANIVYFAAKNDISFRKFPNLINLVMREGHLNFERDNGSFHDMTTKMVVANF